MKITIVKDGAVIDSKTVHVRATEAKAQVLKGAKGEIHVQIMIKTEEGEYDT